LNGINVNSCIVNGTANAKFVSTSSTDIPTTVYHNPNNIGSVTGNDPDILVSMFGASIDPTKTYSITIGGLDGSTYYNVAFINSAGRQVTLGSANPNGHFNFTINPFQWSSMQYLMIFAPGRRWMLPLGGSGDIPTTFPDIGGQTSSGISLPAAYKLSNFVTLTYTV